MVNNVKKKKAANRKNKSQSSINKSKRIGVAEGKLSDFDLDKFNAIDVTEDFYGKDD